MCRIKMKNDSGGPFRTLGGERKLEGLSFLYPGDSPVLDYRPPRNVRGCPGEFPELSALDLDVGRNVQWFPFDDPQAVYKQAHSLF